MSVPSVFEFKQFSLEHGKSAFKLGTDSVVLGSWLSGKGYKRILDIGSGSGILALMMAQKFPDSKIIAIEIDAGSSADANTNFTNSPWFERLKLFNEDVMHWSVTNPDEKFDLIITNPPYFNNSLKNHDQRKSTARHSSYLNPDSMVKIVKQHLNERGDFAVILPAIEFDDLVEKMRSINIYPIQICSISSFKNSQPIRKMGVLGFTSTEPEHQNEFLYNDDRSRSTWYKNISNDFYIK